MPRLAPPPLDFLKVPWQSAGPMPRLAPPWLPMFAHMGPNPEASATLWRFELGVSNVLADVPVMELTTAIDLQMSVRIVVALFLHECVPSLSRQNPSKGCVSPRLAEASRSSLNIAAASYIFLK